MAAATTITTTTTTTTTTTPTTTPTPPPPPPPPLTTPTTLTLLLPLYCYTYSIQLLSTYYYYLLLLATNYWLLLLFLPNLPGLAQDLLSCIFPSAAALCLLSSSCFFFAKSPLSSPLLSFVLPMMKLSKSIHYMEYELMIKNL